jgi:hypothetical protein
MITVKQILLKYNIKPSPIKLHSNIKRDPYETPKINTIIPNTPPTEANPIILTYRDQDHADTKNERLHS